MSVDTLMGKNPDDVKRVKLTKLEDRVDKVR